MAAEGSVEGRVTVRGAASGVVQEIEAGRHHLRSDEPVSVAMLTLMERDVEFDGPLSDAQRERLLAIANRCPVHLTLGSRIDIRTTLRAATEDRVPGGDPA